MHTETFPRRVLKKRTRAHGNKEHFGTDLYETTTVVLDPIDIDLGANYLHGCGGRQPVFDLAIDLGVKTAVVAGQGTFQI